MERKAEAQQLQIPWIRLELLTGNTEVIDFGILGLQFSLPVLSPLVCMSKRNVKPGIGLHPSCSRMRKADSCSVILQLRNHFSCPWIIQAGDKEVSKPWFYFGPDQWLVVWPFTSHLTPLPLYEMSMEELVSYLCHRVTSEGEESGDAQDAQLKAPSQSPSGWPDT